MSVFLSPVGGAGAQFFDNNGNPLTGGKLYTYAAGTTTPQATYTSAAGATFHTNPIVLDAAGRVPGSSEIWLADSQIYKFVLKDSNDVLLATWDQITGVNSNFVNYTTETEVQTATAGQTVFTLTTMSYAPGTGSLTVYVDGVNQYEGTSYLETDSTTVTFTAGLHVGALVKFTTAVQTTGNATDASVVTYDPPFTGGVTTTVQDKLAQTVSVEDFGAVGVLNGGLDDTAAIQAAIDYAASVGKGIVLGGAYRVNFLTIKNGLSFFTSGTLIKTGLVSSNGLIVVNSDVRYCEISDIEMDLNATINRGIFCNGAANCTFDNNRIYNFPAYNPAIIPEAIRLAQNSRYNHVSNNYIVLPADSPYGTYPFAVGIYVTSNALPLGGFETGAFVQPTNLAEKNKIYGNTILNGTHAISLFGGTANEIYDNYIDGPSQRGIHLTPVASQNYIHGNKIYNFGSTAIITAYGSNQNVIIGNYCYAPSSNGEGGIVCYVGATSTLVASNYIYCGSQYGVYLAVNVNNCFVSDNTIVAIANTEAAIAVESDWVSPLPAGATYSKPAYVPPPAPRTNWASEATAWVTIKNNVINNPASGIAGIYVAQIGSVADCVGIRAENNTITTTVPQHHAYYFQDGSSGTVLSQQVLSDLRTSDQTASKVYLANDRNKFAICTGNSIVNDGIVTIVSGTTTPNVSVGQLFQHNDIAPTSVTNYLGAQEGQTIQVRLSANTTIVNNSSLIRLKGGVNVVGTSTNEFLTLRYGGGVWIEQTRNF